MIAVVRVRWHPATRAYAARKITRCLKRHIARQAYHAITADLAHQPIDHGPTSHLTIYRSIS